MLFCLCELALFVCVVVERQSLLDSRCWHVAFPFCLLEGHRTGEIATPLDATWRAVRSARAPRSIMWRMTTRSMEAHAMSRLRHLVCRTHQVRRAPSPYSGRHFQ